MHWKPEVTQREQGFVPSHLRCLSRCKPRARVVVSQRPHAYVKATQDNATQPRKKVKKRKKTEAHMANGNKHKNKRQWDLHLHKLGTRTGPRRRPCQRARRCRWRWWSATCGHRRGLWSPSRRCCASPGSSATRCWTTSPALTHSSGTIGRHMMELARGPAVGRPPDRTPWRETGGGKPAPAVPMARVYGAAGALVVAAVIQRKEKARGSDKQTKQTDRPGEGLSRRRGGKWEVVVLKVWLVLVYLTGGGY